MWYKVKRIMVWQNWQEKQVRPYRFNPWSNTLLYLPLESDTNDHSWNSYTITKSWTITKSDIGYQFGSNGRSYLSTPSLSLDGITDLTVCFWQYVTTVPSKSHIMVSKYIWYNSSPWVCFNFWMYNHNPWWFWHKMLFMIWNTSDTLKEYYSTNDPLWWWKLITGTLSSWTMKSYINWTIDGSVSSVWTFKKVSTPIYIWAYQATNNEYLVWKLSNVIIESKARTSEEISNYYNQTKSNYWL